MPVRLTIATARGKKRREKKKKKKMKKKKSKRIYRASQNIRIMFFLESLLSEPFPSLRVTVQFTSLGCPPTLC